VGGLAFAVTSSPANMRRHVATPRAALHMRRKNFAPNEFSFRFGVGVSPAVGFGGPEAFSHLRQNFFRWSSAVHHGAAISAIDDRPNPPVNELADEKHYVAAVPPFHPLTVRGNRFLQKLKVALGAAPRRAGSEQASAPNNVFVGRSVILRQHRLAPAKSSDPFSELLDRERFHGCAFRGGVLTHHVVTIKPPALLLGNYALLRFRALINAMASLIGAALTEFGGNVFL